jgi:AcrR family transcriptional regulator
MFRFVLFYRHGGRLAKDVHSMKKSLSRPEKSSGRPRSESSRGAILEAAYSFLETQPISAISLLHIARKAGVSTATVYRWWSTKEALLLDAFLAQSGKELAIDVNGAPLERLKRHAIKLGHFCMGRHGVVVARLLTAIQDDPELKEAFFERVVQSPQSKELRVAVKDAMRAGDLPAKTNISDFLDMVFGPIITRLIVQNEPIRESFVISVFDHVVNSTKSLGR